MPSLIISNFRGINRHVSDIDITPEIAVQLKNFSLTKRPGSISKSGAYADVASSLFGSALPSSITWKNIGEMSLTSPSNTDIYLLHGQDGSNNHHLYVGKYWNGSAFTSGFLKLTEAEGQYTAGSGTNDNQVVINSTDPDWASLSSTNDYYNNWEIVINIAAASLLTGAVVTDYQVTATTKTFVIRTAAITGAASSDTFRLSRWQLKTGNIPVVDNIIRFSNRENAVIAMTGNQSQYPTQFQLWYGYVNRTYGTNTTLAKNDFYLDLQPLLKPFVSKTPATGVGSVLEVAEVTSIPGPDSVTYGLNLAYVYDGFQIGPLSEEYTLTINETSSLDITITIPVETCYTSSDALFYQAYADGAGDIPANYAPYLISRRVTAVRLYVVLPGTTAQVFWKEYIIADASTDNNDIDFISSSQRLLRITENSSALPAASSTTYLEDVGQNPVDIKSNFKYGVALDDHFIVAAIRNKTGDRKNNHLIASTVDGSGVATPDNFGGSNIINLGFFGAKEITGIKIIGDVSTTTSPKRRLGVFTDDDFYVLTLTTGSTFDFALDRVGQKEGVVAPDSIVAAEGALFGVSRNGFRMFTEQGSRIIGEGLKDDFDALTDPSEIVGAYFKKYRLVVWSAPTDNKIFAVNLLSSELDMFELSWADAMTILLGSRTGELYTMDGTDIFQQESGTDQNGTAIVPLYKSKRLTARDLFNEETGFQGAADDDILPKESFIRYRSDTAITFNAYRNSGTAITFNNLSLPAQTTIASKRFRWPLGLHCKDLDLEITLSAAQAASNTDFVVEQFKLVADLKSRIET